jgi:Fe-S oxidoreductase
VDIATYRAEFLSHYYEGRMRPLTAYAFGMVDKWLELASAAPGLANFFATAPGISQIVRGALHLAPERELPKLAPVSFRKWARANRVPDTRSLIPDPRSPIPDPRSLILWVDTFNNHIHPETSEAALSVLRGAGFEVAIPSQPLCCGRPLYDFGMLDRAKQYLRSIMTSLGPAIDAGVPLVVLEPSCASVFRDELTNLFPTDPRAERLRNQTFLLSEFLDTRAPGYEPPRLSQRLLLHGHCHHKAIMKLAPEERLLRKTGADVYAPDTGCCGMAGAFGFEADKYTVSQAIGERVLLPAVRNATPDTLIVADGFSCREQIRQATGRKAIHLAEALDKGSRLKA